ncbi:hypothetical protein J6590_026648 [Homalodisca vitripennis]|nr:hypothetical protein J6590_026648 [Homalodisca vitripennis]
MKDRTSIMMWTVELECLHGPINSHDILANRGRERLIPKPMRLMDKVAPCSGRSIRGRGRPAKVSKQLRFAPGGGDHTSEYKSDFPHLEIWVRSSAHSISPWVSREFLSHLNCQLPKSRQGRDANEMTTEEDKELLPAASVDFGARSDDSFQLNPQGSRRII